MPNLPQDITSVMPSRLFSSLTKNVTYDVCTNSVIVIATCPLFISFFLSRLASVSAAASACVVSQIYPLFGALAAGSVAGIYCCGKTTFFSPDIQYVIVFASLLVLTLAPCALTRFGVVPFFADSSQAAGTSILATRRFLMSTRRMGRSITSTKSGSVSFCVCMRIIASLPVVTVSESDELFDLV